MKEYLFVNKHKNEILSVEILGKKNPKQFLSNICFENLFSRGASRIIAVSKSTNESLLNNPTNNSNKQLIFSLNNPQLMHEINMYLQSCPISADDNDILQAKIQKTPSSLNGLWRFSNAFYSFNSVAFRLVLLHIITIG
jgi:hypothetical protein